MILDVIGVILLVVYGFFGYLYGLTGVLINLAAIVAGALAVLAWSAPLSAQVQARWGLSPVLSNPLAATFVFLLVTRTFYVFHLVVRRWIEGEKRGPHVFLALDRLAGAGYGFLKGTVLVAAFSWLVPEVLDPRGFEESRLVTVSRGMIGASARLAGQMAFEDAGTGEVMATLAARPRRFLTHLTRLARSPEVKDLLDEEAFRKPLARGDLEAALGSDAFGRWMSLAPVQESLRGMGFWPRSDEGVTREQLGRMVLELRSKGSRVLLTIKQCGESAEWREFVDDHNVQLALARGLDQGSLLDILRSPKLARILSRSWAAGSDSRLGPPGPATAPPGDRLSQVSRRGPASEDVAVRNY